MTVEANWRTELYKDFDVYVLAIPRAARLGQGCEARRAMGFRGPRVRVRRGPDGRRDTGGPFA